MLTSILVNVILKPTRILGKEGENMNKEEILERSRKDYEKGDEREKMQIQASENRGFTVMAFLVGAFMFFDTGEAIVFGTCIPIKTLMMFIWFTGVSVEMISKYIYFRKKRYLFYFLFVFLLCLLIFIDFCRASFYG